MKKKYKIDFTIKNCPDFKNNFNKTGYNLYDCIKDNFRIDNDILKVIDPMLTRENPNNFNSLK